MGARSSSSRATTAQIQERRSSTPSELVEQERVHLMFGSFGTPSNLATRTYLNEKKYPAALCRLRRRGVGASEAVSVDDGLAADVPRRGTDLRQLHPGRLSEPEDRRALAERPVRPRSVPGIAGGARHHRQHDRGRHRHRGGHVDRYPGRHPQELRCRSARAQLRAADLGACHPQGGRTGLASACWCWSMRRLRSRMR